MRRVVIGALVLVALAAAVTTAAVLAFRDDGDETVAEEPIRITPGSSSLGVYSSGESIAAPMPRLPGITVLGVGEVEVKPDVAFVRLTIGSGSPFGGSEGSVALLDEKEFEPVVDALVGAGAPKDDGYVDTFGGLGLGRATARRQSRSSGRGRKR